MIRISKLLLLALFTLSSLHGAESFTMSKADLDMYFKKGAEDNPAEIDLAEGEEEFEEKIGEGNLAKYLGVSEDGLSKYIAGFPRYVESVDAVITTAQLAQAYLHSKGKKVPKLKKLAKLDLYLKSLANDEKINIDVHADSRIEAMYKLGEEVYSQRRGNRGMSCWGCHTSKDAVGMRLRTQIMVDISSKEGARKSAATWTAYRMAKAKIITLQKRQQQCQGSSGQAVLPQGSKEMVALEVYLTNLSKGAIMNVPGFKR